MCYGKTYVHYMQPSPMVLTLRMVRELREAKGWSQAELARRAGIRAATLSAIETSQTKGIDLDTLEAIANVLGVEPGLLIVRERGRRGRAE